MPRTSVRSRNPLIEEAIGVVGTQARLAQAAASSQQTISRILHNGPITAEVAVRIDRATGGRVSKERLRPDLFGERRVAS